MKRWLGALATCGALLCCSIPAVAAGTALIVGNDAYLGRPTLPTCAAAAQALAARLRRLGYTVDESHDQPSIPLRISVMHFTAAAGSPAVAYVCAEAALRGDRLFILPADLDPRQDLQAETQGIAVRSLLGGMQHDGGLLVAELALPPGMSAAPAMDALAKNLPPGMHVAVAIGDGGQAGALGKVLADDTLQLDDWTAVVGRLRPAAGAGVAIRFAPEPQPLPPPAPPPPAPPPAVPPQVADQPAMPDHPKPATAPGQAAAEQTPVPPQPAAPPRPPVHRTPMTSARVYRLQQALTRHGFFQGPLTGVDDDATHDAVRAFQGYLHDRQTGTPTPPEILFLLNR